MRALARWFTSPVPLGRVAAFRTLVYLFVAADLVFFTPWVRLHADLPGSLYQPLLIGRLLPLPTPGYLLVTVVFWVLLAAALAAATGRAPRLLGWVVAVCWIWYQYVAFSYGKVDHDRADFVVALALLPTVGIAHLLDRRLSEAAGFALRTVQLAAVATYFLSAWAKLRFGGLEWVNSATMVRAVVRRGTPWAQWLLEIPWTLHWFQWVLMAAEITAPVIFLLSETWRRRAVAAWFVFHAMTYAAITIAFWPHLVMMLAFLPLEEYADRLRPRVRSFVQRRLRTGAAPPEASRPVSRPGAGAG